MDFSKFFIDRPIFAAVLSIVIFAAGLISIPLLPIGEYPEVVPPSVVVRTVYPGANPKVIVHGVQKVFFPGMPVSPKQIAMGAPAPQPDAKVAMK